MFGPPLAFGNSRVLADTAQSYQYNLLKKVDFCWLSSGGAITAGGFREFRKEG
jgi:hypothetical protein